MYWNYSENSLIKVTPLSVHVKACYVYIDSNDRNKIVISLPFIVCSIKNNFTFEIAVKSAKYNCAPMFRRFYDATNSGSAELPVMSQTRSVFDCG